MKGIVYMALIATSNCINLNQFGMHACDYVDDQGEEISTSLMPEYV